MNTSVARFLSVVLHPLMMPTLLFTIIFYFAPGAISNLELFNGASKVGVMSLKEGLLLLIFLLTFVIPSFFIYSLYKFGFIQTLTMNTLRERRIPYLITVVIYTMVAAFFTFNVRQLPEIALILTSMAFSIALVAYISLYWKISAHSVGISGVAGALWGILIRFQEQTLFYPALGIILIAGFLMSARLYLNEHNIEQILAGTILGLLVSLFVVIKFV